MQTVTITATSPAGGVRTETISACDLASKTAEYERHGWGVSVHQPAPKTEYVSVADTAKHVRKALAAQFPGVRFSVKSKSYSGGASIRVEWQDGPTQKQVGAVTGKFSGATFDAMIDLKSYHSQEFEGRTVHFGADYINLSRLYSAAFLRSVAERTAKNWGQPVPVVTESPYRGATINDPGKPVSGFYDIRDLTLQDAAKTFIFNGLRCMEKGGG